MWLCAVFSSHKRKFQKFDSIRIRKALTVGCGRMFSLICYYKLKFIKFNNALPEAGGNF